MAVKETENTEPAKSTVTLGIKGTNTKREFALSQANELIKLRNSQWELADTNYQWNGREIAKK